jgi:thiamine biosynthesis lipoprotein
MRSTFRAMGCEVVVAGAGPGALAAIRAHFERHEAAFSRFLPSSELNAVNRDPSPRVRVSGLFASALREALRAAAGTGGLVDPTLGAAIEAAGYDRDFALLPPDAGPAGRAGTGCWHRLRLSGRVLERPPGVRLDLNGVVKALAVDGALALLRGDGLVAAGGDVATRGPELIALPGGGTVRLLAGGIATSGTVHRRWLRGECQHHLIDPRTGRPSDSCWTQVTVAAGSCLAADVAAKAAFLLSEQGPAWLDARGLPGRFLVGDELVLNDAWRRAVGAWPEREATLS